MVGKDCLINAGAVIGFDGFRIEHNYEKKLIRKMIHTGSVSVGNRVEIGANTTIARVTFHGGDTIISDEVKIDGLVHIGHNARIGLRTSIAALTVIGGSASDGRTPSQNVAGMCWLARMWRELLALPVISNRRQSMGGWGVGCVGG